MRTGKSNSVPCIRKDVEDALVGCFRLLYSRLVLLWGYSNANKPLPKPSPRPAVHLLAPQVKSFYRQAHGGRHRGKMVWQDMRAFYEQMEASGTLGGGGYLPLV